MSTPKPGQIRCPTCHESTPPAAFCTRCGQPIPASARARPRGLDRDELEERLRGRRPGDSPYRRGAPAGEAVAAASFDRFEPEPEDALAVREAPASATPAPRVDNLSAPDDAPATSAPGQPAPRWPREAPHRAEPSQRIEPEPAHASAPESPPAFAPEPEAAVDSAPDADDAYDDYGGDYDYDPGTPYYSDERSSGGPWLIVGVIGLGLVALLGGVLISGLFSAGPGVARETASPTVAAQPTPTATPSGEATPTPSPSPGASQGPPGTFPDGFTASVQPCASTDMTKDGCAEGGSTLSGDTVWVWAGFTKGTGQDVVGVTLVDGATDEAIQDASLELSRVNCTDVCNGYLKFSFSGISAGDYLLRVSRNGSFAAEAPFTVTG